MTQRGILDRKTGPDGPVTAQQKRTCKAFPELTFHNVLDGREFAGFQLRGADLRTLVQPFLKSSLPMIILLISLVPAPISNSFASRSSRPVGYSLTYPFPPRHWMACRGQTRKRKMTFLGISAEMVKTDIGSTPGKVKPEGRPGWLFRRRRG